MKVKELIKQLKKLDPELDVVIPTDNFGETGDLTDDFDVRVVNDQVYITERW